MKEFNRLELYDDRYYINKKTVFKPLGFMLIDLIDTVFDFAYSMTFGGVGEHRTNRTGGTHKRKNGEIFSNVFQGKLAEFALYSYLKELNIQSIKPDTNPYKLGIWDNTDLEVKNKFISIKSTKSFGNLLLLEENDWDDQGNYLPNLKAYDFIVLIRIKPFLEQILKKNKLLYSEKVDKEFLKKIVFSEVWYFDIPGFITLDDYKYLIKNRFIIKKGANLNQNTVMDASNYYVQSGDLRPIEHLAKILKLL